MLTLAQLRDRQKNGEVSGGVVGDEKPVLSVSKPAEGPAPMADRVATSIQGPGNGIRKDGPSADLTATRGYIKIFPPRFASISQVPEEFKKEFWTGPSPWCRVEGVEDHPDFENNLKTIENA